MNDSIVKFEKQPIAFLKEVVKYVFLGKGLLTFPSIGMSIFANSEHLDSKYRLTASPEQQDSRNPKNLPDIEVMIVGS